MSVEEELSALWAQKLHEARNGGKETATRVHCARCGTRFKPTVSQLRRAARTDRVRATAGKNGELYCSRSCWRAASWEPVTCPTCGTPFSRQRSETRVYCSMACHAKAQERKVEVPCVVCGTSVVRSPFQLSRFKPTCSPRCSGIVAASGRSSNRIEKPCGSCGTTMRITARAAERKNYCSRACYDVARAKA